eukprot:scaffold213186_cov26-Prasinocladus_malaysianus.AAC.1
MLFYNSPGSTQRRHGATHSAGIVVGEGAGGAPHGRLSAHQCNSAAKALQLPGLRDRLGHLGDVGHKLQALALHRAPRDEDGPSAGCRAPALSPGDADLGGVPGARSTCIAAMPTHTSAPFARQNLRLYWQASHLPYFRPYVRKPYKHYSCSTQLTFDLSSSK